MSRNHWVIWFSSWPLEPIRNFCHNDKKAKSVHRRNTNPTGEGAQQPSAEKKELMASLQNVNKELDAEIKVRLQYQSEKLELAAKELTNRELIFELKTNISKITSELEMHDSEKVELLTTSKKLEDCEGESQNKTRKNNQLELENSIISESLREFKQEALTNQTSSAKEILVLKTNLNETQEEISNCQKSLQVYKDSIEKICPMWGEWSDCSKSCFGMKIRKDKCNDANEQIDLCNDHSACHKSGQ